MSMSTPNTQPYLYVFEEKMVATRTTNDSGAQRLKEGTTNVYISHTCVGGLSTSEFPAIKAGPIFETARLTG